MLDGGDAASYGSIDGTVVYDGGGTDSSSSISYSYCTTLTTTKPVLLAWTCTLIHTDTSINHTGCTYS